MRGFRFACVLVFAGILVSGACTDAAGPRWIQRVDPSPDSVHLKIGESRAFGVEVFDQDGRPMSDGWVPRVQWSSTRPSVAALEMLEEGPVVTAVGPGIAYVRAELGRGQADAPVYVQPPGLERIEIDPSPVKVSPLSLREKVDAHLLDASGEEMGFHGFRVSWKVRDTTVAYISNYDPTEFALVWGRTPGTTQLVLVVGDTAVYSDVTVIPEPLAPLAPSVATVSSTKLQVTWPHETGATAGYEVYRTTGGQGAYAHIGSTGGGQLFAKFDTTYLDHGLTPSTTYFYVIEACHLTAGCSERSPPGSGTTAEGG